MTKKKTVVFLCKCGTNIADYVDLDQLGLWAEERDDVLCVKSHDLLCSPDGKEFFKETLKSEDTDSVVLAACSPKMHEKTFQDLAEEVGVNMSQVHLANIREQCGWVTTDKDHATEKARDLMRAAINRSWYAEPLEKRSMEVNTDVLIIGGGVAGIEAALTASKAGRKVFLVERDISLGGSVIQCEEVAPNMECAPCFLAPRLAEVRDDPNIEVMTNAEVTAVLGFYGAFTAHINKRARAVDDSCIGCEACFEVCPVDVKSEFHLGLGTHKAIYTQFPGSVPAAAVIDKDACSHYTDGSCDACVEACPFGSIAFDQQDEDIEVNVGAIVVATGYDNIDPTGVSDLGYGTIDNVYTLAEFERIASSNGPYGGTIQLKDGTPPQAIAVVHCTGDMFSENGAPYSQPSTNLLAVKMGDYIRKQFPEAKVYNIHGDLVFAEHADYRFYEHQKEEGAVFLRVSDMKSVRVSASGRIKVEGQGFEALEVDMVVLATDQKPALGTIELAELLNADLDEFGYFKSDHDLLNQTGATIDGVYIAGCAAGPCDVGAAITRGRSTVGDALSKLVPGREIELEVMTSTIDEELCGACKLCVTVCPYKAVAYDETKDVCVVNEAICRGCGTCTASCPSSASRARHFTDEQMYAEIGGVLHG